MAWFPLRARRPARPDLPVRIIVRTATDWSTMTREKFAGQQDPVLPLMWINVAAKLDAFRLWDEVFEVDYFTYRGRVQSIAFESCKAVAGATITVGLADAASWLESPGDEILVPIDDDDFFAADLSDVARHFVRDTAVVLCPIVQAGFVDYRQRPRFRRLWWPIMSANNFAIRKSYLVESFSVPDIVKILAHDPTGDRMISAQLKQPDRTPKLLGIPFLTHRRVRWTWRCFGMYNVHPGSIYFLKEAMTKDDPRGFLQSLQLDRAMRVPRYARQFEAHVRRLEAEGAMLRRRRAA